MIGGLIFVPLAAYFVILGRGRKEGEEAWGRQENSEEVS